MRPYGIRLSIKLPAFVMLGVSLTALAAGLLAVFFGRQLMRERALQANVDSVQAYAGAISVYLDNARSLLELTAGQLGPSAAGSMAITGLLRGDGQDGSDSSFHSAAANILAHSRVFEYLLLLGPDGLVEHVEPRELKATLARRDLGYAGWHKRMMGTGATVVSELVISPVTQKPTVIVATPIRGPRGEVQAVWAGGLRLEHLSLLGVEAATRARAERFGYVTDQRGLIIAHQADRKDVDEQTDFSAVPAVRAALAGGSGAMAFFSPIRREQMLGAFTPLPEVGWAVVYVTPARVADAPVIVLTRRILLAAAGLALVLGLLGLVFVRRITDPIRHMATAAQALEKGELNQHIEVRTGDEIGSLAGAFNRMAAGLAEKESLLLQRAAQLETANKELEAFSYSVSHDLRAPLRHLTGFVGLLEGRAGTALDEKSRHYLEVIAGAARQMGQLVDDLLAFSRMGRVELMKQRVRLADVVREALEELRPGEPGREVALKVGNLPEVVGDAAMLKQVFLNLIGNALKYTGRRERAEVEVGTAPAADGEICCFVRDNGAGFDMKYVDKLFGLFQRLHHQDEFAGTGVGLANVKRIITRHGGRVWAEGAVDRGATFSFTLPALKEATA